jgi:type VI protein secretion system component Hcp
MLSKTLTRAALTLAVLMCGVSPARAQAQTQTFMLVNGGAIPGDSTVDAYRNWIDLFSITHSLAPSGKALNACAIDVGKGIDSAGPRLWAAAVAAQNLGPVQIDIRRAGGEPFKFYEILVANARVTSIVSTPDQFLERLTLTGDSVTVKFIGQSATGQPLPVVTTVNCR